MMGRGIRFCTLMFGAMVVAHALPAYAQSPLPIATDSRIRTLVYNENEVFPLVTYYGFQSNIEFAEREEIQTLSIGDQIGWQVVPAGRYLFIKAMQKTARTNMTVITDKHTYQFDLQSRDGGGEADKDLAYVIRFFYPDGNWNAPAGDGEMQATPASFEAPAAMPMNFNYTLSGPDEIAPMRVFDDGQFTYFEFPAAGMTAPEIAMVDETGREQPASALPRNGMVAVTGIASQFTVRANGQLVCVYNESMPQQSMP